jgi:hypothetical protein
MRAVNVTVNYSNVQACTDAASCDRSVNNLGMEMYIGGDHAASPRPRGNVGVKFIEL